MASLCKEKARLIFQLDDAASAHSQSIRKQSAQMAVLSKEKYEAFRAHADQLRARSETARLALERHLSEHGC
jgi:hypothetical protein